MPDNLTSKPSVLDRLRAAHPPGPNHASKFDCPVCALIVELEREAAGTTPEVRLADETTPFLFPHLSPLGKDCGQGSGHVAVKLLTTDDGTAHACEKCSTMWFVPYGAAVKAPACRYCDDGLPLSKGWHELPNDKGYIACPAEQATEGQCTCPKNYPASLGHIASCPRCYK